MKDLKTPVRSMLQRWPIEVFNLILEILTIQFLLNSLIESCIGIVFLEQGVIINWPRWPCVLDVCQQKLCVRTPMAILAKTILLVDPPSSCAIAIHEGIRWGDKPIRWLTFNLSWW